MTNVSFEEEQSLPSVTIAKPRGLPAKLVKWGIVQNELQANIVLLALTVLIAGAAVYVYMLGQPTPHVLTPQELLEAERMNAAGSQR